MEQKAVDAEGDSLERSRLIQAFLKVRIRGTSALTEHCSIIPFSMLVCHWIALVPNDAHTRAP